MASVSHHDESRAGVGVTAFGVASLRAYETKKGDSALIHDEFAEIMGGEVGNAWLVSLPDERLDVLRNGLAVRTRKLDVEVLHGLHDLAITQVVVVGAGLDCRPWRLHSCMYDEAPGSKLSLDGKKEIYNRTKYFELDFQEIFDVKLSKLAEHGSATSLFEYHSIVANVCVHPWVDLLKAKGFDSSIPTMWLLEGFTGYLTEEELKIVFDKIRDNSATGSKFIGTFISPSYDTGIQLHRFRVEDAMGFLAQWNWKGEQEQFSSICERYGYACPGWSGYLIVVAYM